ncbi:MAG: FG-GAP-like repeat-containing protein, partial [Acidimicrobiales bacterium]
SGYFYYADHFPTMEQLFISRFWGYGLSLAGDDDGISFQIGWLHWGVVGVAILMAPFLWRRSRAGFLTVAVMVAFFWVSVLMMQSGSGFLWRTFDTLQWQQFPWRFLSLVIFTASFLAGAIVLPAKGRPYVSLLLSVVLIGAVIGLNQEYFRFGQRIFITDSQQFSTPGYNQGVSMTDFSLPGRQRGAKWRSRNPTIALSGIGWIRGADWGGWDGELAGATLKDSRLWVFEFANNNRLLDTDQPAELAGTFGRLRVPVMGPDGALYVASSGTGTVVRAVPPTGRKPGGQDVNGDGYDDLVVGGPGEDIRGKRNAGGFHVLYGSAAGLSPNNGTELRHQGKLKGAKPQAGDRMGSAVAYGDVDGDGTSDIVVGTPREDVGGAADAGAVQVVCGRTNGIEARSSQTFSQRGSVAGTAEPGDRMGSAVAMGDFDGDGLDDVASGAPREDVSGASAAGAVTVLYGTPTGMTTEGSQEWSQAGGVAGTAEAGDRFGTALAAGDFDGDGNDDLAIGVPFEDVGSSADAGAVTILYGSNAGLGTARSAVFDQTQTSSDNAAGDRFGTSLVVGDFNGDGREDLAVGAPRESVGGATEAGEVTVLFGSAAGLTSTSAQVLSQSGAVPGSNEAGDRFGSALGAGDTDGDGDDDLVVGSSGEDNNAGRIVVFNGSGSGLVKAGASFSQRGPIPGRAEAGDRMGASVRVADFNGDGFMDAAVGLPGEGVKGRKRAGAIVVLEGSANGLTTAGSRYITQASKGVPGQPRTGDAWGTAM